MANVVWPDGLPQRPAYDAYQEALPTLVIRTQMDAGVAKMRRRYTAGPRPIRLLLHLTAEEVAIFDDFFTEALEGGALRFEWVNFRTEEPADYRFTEAPTYVPISQDLWRVQCKLEQMPL